MTDNPLSRTPIEALTQTCAEVFPAQIVPTLGKDILDYLGHGSLDLAGPCFRFISSNSKRSLSS